ncbi:peptidylprolyl isomerase [Actinobacillus delphinicola]|uniref:peptidylprolyl isomerase n=1 Tax=Actinobacillus delphinicola TaxID=51161 RepID=UPI002441A2AE|nr:peptidylprolyl isomerase [Actinobacillus delphinicola]MDG6897609.1 peptidylprolyl isomerase [Actinobacillus delphinicola]
MKVTKDKVVSIAYQLRNQDGVLIDEAPTNQPLTYLQGHNNLIIGLENALEGKDVGEKFEVRVKPEEGYGEYSDMMVQRVPKAAFEGAVEELKPGMRFIAETDRGPLPVVITAVEGDEVVVDGNHMLAGQELLFNVEVVEVRDATLEELAHGHIHAAPAQDGCCGGHGHHHHEADHECCGGHGHHHEEDHECCGGHGEGKGGCGCSH